MDKFINEIPVEISIYAYQLRPNDFVSWYGVYHRVLNLKGTHVHDIGLAVSVTCARGTCVVPYNLVITVLRYADNL